MEIRRLSIGLMGLVLAIGSLAAGNAMATSFTVHGYELGEHIRLSNGTQVYTAQLDVSVEGIASHVPSFCVDLDTFIAAGSYSIRDVLDAYNDPSPVGEASRDFRWAGHVLEHFSVGALAVGGISRVEAITGIQAAIWEGIYSGLTIDAASLSADARLVFESIMSTTVQGDGPALVVDLVGYQDQVILGSHAVPEPSAALVFGLGSVIAGSLVRRRAA